MQVDFLNDLNESQRKAVEYTDGPSLVIAGAGSGKTRVLTYKIAYLLQSGVMPWEILALTFTNKAANEMKERIAKLVGADKAKGLWMGTFHSIFNHILHREAENLDFDPRYTIYQPSDSQSLIKTILKEMGLDDKTYKPAAVAGRISEAKNALILPRDYRSSTDIYQRDTKASVPKIGDIYGRYVERMHQANAMDFDDLLVNTFLLFQRFPEIRQKYASHFMWVLVDEYQDTNYAQHQILRQLCEERQNICVVGDDAQSIYGFRGAKIDNILNFDRTYKDAKLFKLERNYRSTRNIVSAANSLIAHNRRQIKKEVFSENEVGQPLTVSQVYSDVEEGEKVCNRISWLHSREHLEFCDFAILYRTNAQSRIFEEALLKRHIPYRIYGGQSFYDHKEIRDVLAYFRLVVNPSDEEAFKRILNVPARGIGLVTRDKVLAVAAQHNLSVWNVLEHPLEAGLDVNKGTLSKLEDFHLKMADFMSCRDTLDAYTLGHRIIMETGLWADAVRRNDAEGKEDKELLEELLNGLNTFVEMRRESGEGAYTSLQDYLNEVSLLSDKDIDDKDNVNVVTLMTVHAAKGLEFASVFIVGLEKDLFPNAMASLYQREMEEERRLFYVAITRAKKYCYLSWAKSRFRYGSFDFCEPSPFLNEIDAQYMYYESNGFQKNTGYSSKNYERPVAEYDTNSVFNNVLKPKPTNTVDKPRSLKRLPVANSEDKNQVVQQSTVRYNGQPLTVGQRVAHQRFGEGIVRSLEIDSGDVKAVIEFDNEGKKNLLLKYAKLTLI